MYTKHALVVLKQSISQLGVYKSHVWTMNEYQTISYKAEGRKMESPFSKHQRNTVYGRRDESVNVLMENQ